MYQSLSITINNYPLTNVNRCKLLQASCEGDAPYGNEERRSREGVRMPLDSIAEALLDDCEGRAPFTVVKKHGSKKEMAPECHHDR